MKNLILVRIVFSLFLTWTLYGHSEWNSGSYETVKWIEGSFNQGNIAMLSVTGGHLYACNVIFAICWSFIRKLSCWAEIHLNHILIEETEILELISFLSVDDLPKQFNLFQHVADLIIKQESLHDDVAFWNEAFLRNIFALSNETSTCLLFTYDYTVPIIKYLIVIV